MRRKWIATRPFHQCESTSCDSRRDSDVIFDVVSVNQRAVTVAVTVFRLSMRFQMTLDVPKSKLTLGPTWLHGGFVHQSSAEGPSGKNAEHCKNKKHQTNVGASLPRLSKTTHRVGKVLVSRALSLKKQAPLDLPVFRKLSYMAQVVEDQDWRARPQYRP